MERKKKKFYEAPQLIEYGPVAAFTADADDKCGSVVDSFTQATSLDGNVQACVSA